MQPDPSPPRPPALLQHSGLLEHSALWQAGRRGRPRSAIPSGHAALDAQLADGGWPRAALSELLSPVFGIGELPLLLPALATLARDGGRIVLLTPPLLPCLAGWQAAGIAARQLWLLTPPDARSWLWSAEQVLRTPGHTLLAWPGKHPLGLRELRRLQLAAQAGDGMAVLLRSEHWRSQSSPTALRLLLSAAPQNCLRVEVLKQRGGFGGGTCALPLAEKQVLPRIPPWQLPVHRPQPAHSPVADVPRRSTSIASPEAATRSSP